MQAIEIKELRKQFKGKKGSVIEALQGISISVAMGEVFGFLGPNGAGKSTTIKCVMGLIHPSSGSASIMGRPVSDHEARKTVGYLQENPAFYEYLSAEEYLFFVGRVFKTPDDILKQRVAEVLELLSLTDACKRPMRGYSKGMVQRVGLAQALVHDPDVYILDEPMSGLDPIGRALVKDIILDLKSRGKCVFFSTHITDDIEKVCDRVGVINKGRLLVVDSVSNILQRGLEGYVVRVTDQNGKSDEFVVEKADLQSFISQSAANHQSIEKIEPRRKDMEAFFLEIVA